MSFFPWNFSSTLPHAQTGEQAVGTETLPCQESQTMSRHLWEWAQDRKQAQWKLLRSHTVGALQLLPFPCDCPLTEAAPQWLFPFQSHCGSFFPSKGTVALNAFCKGTVALPFPKALWLIPFQRHCGPSLKPCFGVGSSFPLCWFLALSQVWN